MAETWRVVLASGEAREVECLYIGTVALAKIYGLRAEGIAVSGQGDNFVEAILDLARDGRLRIVEILAPGEMTRAELAARLAAASRARGFAGLVRSLGAEVRRVTRERDVLRAQQAPMLDAHDALVAAARAAGWTGAGATGAELVAWVRRGALLDAARIAMERGGEWVAKAIVARANEEGGE